MPRLHPCHHQSSAIQIALSHVTEIDAYWRSVHNTYAEMNYDDACDRDADSPFHSVSDLSSAQWVHFMAMLVCAYPLPHPVGDSCGTKNTGWLANPHPPVGSAPRDVTVCFQVGPTTAHLCAVRANAQVCACSYDGGQSITYMYRLSSAVGLPVRLLRDRCRRRCWYDRSANAIDFR